MKTNELTGAALDWAVMQCKGLVWSLHGHIPFSTDWAQGGPIIEREGLTVGYANIEGGFWTARTTAYPPEYTRGPTPLIAAMRCYVASKMGDEIDVPVV